MVHKNELLRHDPLFSRPVILRRPSAGSAAGPGAAIFKPAAGLLPQLNILKLMVIFRSGKGFADAVEPFNDVGLGIGKREPDVFVTAEIQTGHHAHIGDFQ